MYNSTTNRTHFSKPNYWRNQNSKLKHHNDSGISQGISHFNAVGIHLTELTELMTLGTVKQIFPQRIFEAIASGDSETKTNRRQYT